MSNIAHKILILILTRYTKKPHQKYGSAYKITNKHSGNIGNVVVEIS